MIKKQAPARSLAHTHTFDCAIKIVHCNRGTLSTLPFQFLITQPFLYWIDSTEQKWANARIGETLNARMVLFEHHLEWLKQQTPKNYFVKCVNICTDVCSGNLNIWFDSGSMARDQAYENKTHARICNFFFLLKQFGKTEWTHHQHQLTSFSLITRGARLFCLLFFALTEQNPGTENK